MPYYEQDRTVDEVKELAKAKKILKRDYGAFASGRAAMSPKIKRDKALVR